MRTKGRNPLPRPACTGMAERPPEGEFCVRMIHIPRPARALKRGFAKTAR
ncbi:hypothetical protein OCOJLMKI_0561 [Methylobacterium iners]|uniref:Uncharacterized protein n=1 Tax=Methylobacterium iners TaxID=418707 RepID=A0ABQ4RT48_9HYPH|nr:hypothetical protein OCOJLMKI_0561 [Methylobacterium iners]